MTSDGTASASELTMDGLGAYIDVIRIGGTTYGKFVGSITLYDSPDNGYTSADNIKPPYNHGWTMQPIVFGYWNAKNNPHPQKQMITQMVVLCLRSLLILMIISVL